MNRILIFKVFNYICEYENVELEFDETLRKKIKSTLETLYKKWKTIKERKTAKKKFISSCRDEFVEFKVTLKDQTMEIDSAHLENLFDSLNI